MDDITRLLPMARSLAKKYSGGDLEEAISLAQFELVRASRAFPGAYACGVSHATWCYQAVKQALCNAARSRSRERAAMREATRREDDEERRREVARGRDTLEVDLIDLDIPDLDWKISELGDDVRSITNWTGYTRDALLRILREKTCHPPKTSVPSSATT